MKFLLFLFLVFLGFFDLFFVLYFSMMSLFFFVLMGKTFMGFMNFDSVSYSMVFLVLFVFLCVYLFLLSNFYNDSFCLSKILFVWVMNMLTVLSFSFMSIILFYMSFEFIFLMMFFFIVMWGHSMERLQASFYMMFYTFVVSMPFLVSLVMFSDTTSCMHVFVKMNSSFIYPPFIIVLFCVKLPLFLVHVWLPKAHVESPFTGSMILAGVMLKLGCYGFYRILFFFSSFFYKYSMFFFSLGVFSFFFGAVLCLIQSDLKSMVAYSSICHMGLFFSGLMSYSFVGWEGGLVMVLSHGISSSSLFMMVGLAYDRLMTRSVINLGGFKKSFYYFSWFWLISNLCNMGMPPLFSFFSEIELISSLLMVSMYSIFFCLASTFFVGFYSIYMYMLFSESHSNSESNLQLTFLEKKVVYLHFYYMVFMPLFYQFFF